MALEKRGESLLLTPSSLHYPHLPGLYLSDSNRGKTVKITQLCSSLLGKLRRSVMFIATGPPCRPAKLRRSGMELMSLNDWCRARLIRPGICRSYGAWLTRRNNVAINMARLTELSPG